LTHPTGHPTLQKSAEPLLLHEANPLHLQLREAPAATRLEKFVGEIHMESWDLQGGAPQVMFVGL